MKYAAKRYIRGVCVDLGAGKSPYRKYLNVDRYITVDKFMDKVDIKADITKLPLKGKIADTVLINQVLEHVFEYEELLKEAKRILKDNGVMILSVPFIYNVHFEPYDYFRFSEFSLKKLLEKHHFEKIEILYCGYGGTAIVSLVNNLIWQLFNKNAFLRILRNTFFILPILCLFLMNNVLGLFIDIVKNEKFCPNYFLICGVKNE